MNAAGEIVIDARRYRTQLRNREDAMERLKKLIERASLPPKARRKSAPPPSSGIRRLDEKKRCSGVKKLRGRADIDNL